MKRECYIASPVEDEPPSPTFSSPVIGSQHMLAEKSSKNSRNHHPSLLLRKVPLADQWRHIVPVQHWGINE
jgi:hypothetical protein